jgi:hypothetical protein
MDTDAILNLKRRIRHGKVWLEKNESSWQYLSALKEYEKLVDQAVEFGISEEECWSFQDVVGDMDKKEVLTLLT